MERELAEIAGDRSVILFALGCLSAIAGMAAAQCVRSLLVSARANAIPPEPEIRSTLNMHNITARPRLLGLICAAAAVGMGLVYMSAAGAPFQYSAMNIAALMLGVGAWAALGRTATSGLSGGGATTLGLAASLLLTALFGNGVDGAARWVTLGQLNLQVSLIVIPVMLVIHARKPDAMGALAMIVAALALALQPDRAMAGVLTASLLILVMSKRSGLTVVAAGAASLAFGWTLLRPDLLPAVPFVDRVFNTAFNVHPVVGFAVALGTIALVAPVLIGVWKSGSERPALLTFGACWLGVVAAAALGNYPTPLVGYGGSAVLGYLLSVALLPNTARAFDSKRAPVEPSADGGRADQRISQLDAVRLA